MKRILDNRFWWVILLSAFAVVIYIASYINGRVDLTEEKRYSLTESTESLLESLDTTVTIEVYLTGDLSAGLRKVRESVDETLDQYRDIAKGKISVQYINPFEIDDDSAQAEMIDSLGRYGITPFTQVAQESKGTAQTQRLVMPGAVVKSRNGIYAINFLKGVNNADEQMFYTNIESLLEYKFSNAIEKSTRTEVPLIAYALGNGQSLGYDAVEAITTLASEYRLDTVNLDNVSVVPNDYKCLIILQPKEKFTQEDKLKIDQYLMHGGTVFFAADIVDAPLDSLQLKGSALAYDKGLDITDLLFRYGIRINPDLVQDYQSTDISMVVGESGGKPQLQNVKWPYYPLVTGKNHPISKNMDPVFIKYGNSIDTVQASGVKRTILLSTSVNGKIVASPAIISFNSLQYAEDASVFNKPHIPVAVLAEGSFRSLFANRLPQQQLDSLSAIGYKFLAASNPNAKLIVVSDGDAFLNEVTQKGPMPVGMNRFIGYTFANKDFFQNSIDYLTGTSGIFESRNKTFTVRLLNQEKVEAERSTWLFVNIGLPVVLILLVGFLLQWLRKRRYAA